MPGEQIPQAITFPSDFYQSVLYQASKLSSASLILVPNKKTTDERVEDYLTVGQMGETNVEFKTATDFTRVDYVKVAKDIQWDKYAFAVLDSTKLKTRKEIALKIDEHQLQSATDFFAAASDYIVLNEILDKVSTSSPDMQVATTGSVTWDDEAAKIEKDIVLGFNAVFSNSNANWKELQSAKIFVPAAVYSGLNTLQLVNNIQQQMKRYLQESFELTENAFIPYKPYYDQDGTAQLDALSTSALIVIPGAQLGSYYRYDPVEALRRGVQLAEQWRIPDQGNAYVQWLGHSCLIYPDIRTSAATKTTRAYEITGVKS